jgi:dipeptidyl aminopeptidase/acylaminoacyl peptidase
MMRLVPWLLFFAVAAVFAPLTIPSSCYAAEKRAMEVDDLFRFERLGDPQISPDGKQVVFVVTTVDLERNSTRSNLWIANVADLKNPRRLTTSEKKDLHPRWSPDGTRIMFQSTRSGSMQLWAIDLTGGEARQLTQISTEAGNGTWSPDGKAIAFVSGVYPEFSTLPYSESNAKNQEKADAISSSPIKARVFDQLFFRHWDSYVEDKRQHLFVCRFDPATGKCSEPKDVTPGDRDAYPTSTTFSVDDDFCFSPDSTHLIFTAVPKENEAWNTNYDLCRVSITGGTSDWESLTNNPAADGAPAFSFDGKQLAYRAQTRSGFEADKWDVMIADCNASGSITSDPKKLTAKLDRSADSLSWARGKAGNAFITFIAQQDGKSLVFSVSPSGGNDPAAAQQDWSIMSVSTNASNGNYAFLGSKLDAPPEIFVIHDVNGQSTSTACGTFNTELHSQIQWGSIESFTVAGAEGTPMQMWLVKPPNFDASKKWPLAFLVHGGPQGAWMNSWSNRWNPQVWAAQGYVVALPNPRGSTGFGQTYTDQISGDWGGRCYVDLMKGLEHLEQLPYIDKDRMFSAGASFGGYMMNWFQGNTTKFKTLVTHCGVYNFESMYATTEEIWFDEFEHGGPPWGGNRESYEKHSPHRLAANFKTPMLIIHNDLDFRVPVSEGIQLFTTLQRLGVPSKFINFPDEGHWVNKPANSKFWHEQIFDWVGKYCPPGAK